MLKRLRSSFQAVPLPQLRAPLQDKLVVIFSFSLLRVCACACVCVCACGHSLALLDPGAGAGMTQHVFLASAGVSAEALFPPGMFRDLEERGVDASCMVGAGQA